MNNPSKPKLSTDVLLTGTTGYDSRVRLDADRFQRCVLWIGGMGYGSVQIVGTPEQFHTLAAQLQTCATDAENAEAARALDKATSAVAAVRALTDAGTDRDREYTACSEVRPGTLGYQRCRLEHGHAGEHRSQDRGTWTGTPQTAGGAR